MKTSHYYEICTKKHKKADIPFSAPVSSVFTISQFDVLKYRLPEMHTILCTNRTDNAIYTDVYSIFVLCL